MRLSTHFTLKEMIHSDKAIELGIDNSLDPDDADDAKIIRCLVYVCETILEPAREHYGKPITPSSGYRCKALNTAVKGSPVSQHMKGEAVDFEIPGVANIDLAYWLARNIKDFDQIILERYERHKPSAGWVHMSNIPSANRNECRTMGPTISALGLPAT